MSRNLHSFREVIYEKKMLNMSQRMEGFYWISEITNMTKYNIQNTRVLFVLIM